MKPGAEIKVETAWTLVVVEATYVVKVKLVKVCDSELYISGIYLEYPIICDVVKSRGRTFWRPFLNILHNEYGGYALYLENSAKVYGVSKDQPCEPDLTEIVSENLRKCAEESLPAWGWVSCTRRGKKFLTYKPRF